MNERTPGVDSQSAPGGPSRGTQRIPRPGPRRCLPEYRVGTESQCILPRGHASIIEGMDDHLGWFRVAGGGRSHTQLLVMSENYLPSFVTDIENLSAEHREHVRYVLRNLRKWLNDTPKTNYA